MVLAEPSSGSRPFADSHRAPLARDGGGGGLSLNPTHSYGGTIGQGGSRFDYGGIYLERYRGTLVIRDDALLAVPRVR